MSKLNDRELSLAVARIIMPDWKWSLMRGSARGQKDVESDEWFRYQSDDALGKMCVWYAKHLDDLDMPISGSYTRFRRLTLDNPHRAIAEAIVETKGEEA